MKIRTDNVLDNLPAEEPCLGAVFTSYSFDPGFFENHVLRAVLHLTSDPVEDVHRYHDEARRKLQQVPVAAVVDAGERQPGRRLPYDLIEISDVVFHPKSALLLYNDHARLMVGSGNLTLAGFGENTEIFLCLELAYDNGADVSLLQSFEAHLNRIAQFILRPGSQLTFFREEFYRRMASAKKPAVPSSKVAIIDSTKSPIIEQLKALLPDNAVVESIGMLAPFYERDDAGDLDDSVFGALAQLAVKDTVLDVGVRWDNTEVYPAAHSTLLEDGLNRLWGWSDDPGGARYVKYLVPTSIGRSTLSYTNKHGKGRRRPLDEAVEAAEDRTLWMLQRPVAFAPRQALDAAGKRFAEVRLWLHPSTRMLDGRPAHRPLHAKLLLVGFRRGRGRETLVLMGSANMTRKALLQRAEPGRGNAELGLAFRLEGSVTLTDFAPELVRVPRSLLELQERAFLELARNYALMIEEAVHDPEKRSLTVTWAEEAQELAAWRLTYDGEEISRSDIAPSAPVVVDDFVLKQSSAEVVLHVEDDEYPVPILVTDLVALPATPEGSGLALDELLMLLGRRIGAERAVQIAQRRSLGSDDADELAVFFGEGFGPADVFRAWWAVAEDLGDPALSVPAFRLRLEGSLGVGAAWSRITEVVTDEGSLQPSEAWFYGAELLRTLEEVELPPGADRDAKAERLAAFAKRVRADLAGIDPGARGPWLRRIRTFYKETRA